MHLTNTCFLPKLKSSVTNISSNDSASSLQSISTPASVFVDMPSPRYLGPAPTPGSSYFFTNDNGTMDIVRLDAPVVLGEKAHDIHPDDISVSGSEFSITSSMAQILDRSDSSASSVGFSPTAKRPHAIPSSSNTEVTNSNKRVKFESDL